MKRALVFGRAKGVWDELDRAQQLGQFDFVLGVGSAVVDYPGHLDALVSFHAELFEHWVNKRRQKGYPDPTHYISSTYQGKAYQRAVANHIPVRYVRCEGGSSGLIGAIAAAEILGADRVVLAGIPMEQSAGQYDTGADWREAEVHRVGWRNNIGRVQDKVRSMSGWTSVVLGVPTKEWLGFGRAAA